MNTAVLTACSAASALNAASSAVVLPAFRRQRFQPRGELLQPLARAGRAQGLGDRFLVEREIVLEEVRRPRGHVLEQLDLLLDRRQHVIEVLVAELPDRQPGRAHHGQAQFAEPLQASSAAMYWPLSQKHLSGSNEALRRLTLSSSKIATTSSSEIFSRLSFGDQPSRQR